MWEVVDEYQYGLNISAPVSTETYFTNPLFTNLLQILWLVIILKRHGQSQDFGL